MIFAGVVGSSITADLGARKIREELDAMSVLGVDMVRTLVVPRIVALTLMAPVLGALALTLAVGGIFVLSPILLPNATHPAYVDSLRSIINAADIFSFALRCMITGLFVGVVCCAKGLGTSGGAEGVGRAVNQAVLITFMGIWVLNSLWNAVFLPTFPDVSILRG
jgi:phospholipid/cholesterol/gamma-HCH transport system permease protein